MHWIYLIAAILFEVAGTSSMKASEGFTKVGPSILLMVFYIASLSFLTLALKGLDVSLAYAVWSGMGIVIITFIGVFYFGETITWLKAMAIILIIAGVVILNVAGGHSTEDAPQIGKETNS